MTDIYGVHQRHVIDAPAERVFSELVDPEALGDWLDGLLVSSQPDGLFTLITKDGTLVHARLVEALRSRRLILFWRHADDPAMPDGSTVRFDLTPLGPRTVLELTHVPNEESTKRKESPMTDVNNCEWCGRDGGVVELAVGSADGATDFALPVLCHVCAALIGITQPRGYGTMPFWDGLLDADPGPGPEPASPERVRWLEDLDGQLVGAARSQVLGLLTENHARKGRHAPAWAAAPS